MNNIEKGLAAITVAGTLIGIGVSWNSLNNRIDRLDERVAKVQDALGSAACNAILPRQIEAIEKNHREAREALEKLSARYDCGPHPAPPPAPGTGAWADAMTAMNATAPDTADLNAQLNAVDVLLNNND